MQSVRLFDIVLVLDSGAIIEIIEFISENVANFLFRLLFFTVRIDLYAAFVTVAHDFPAASQDFSFSAFLS